MLSTFKRQLKHFYTVYRKKLCKIIFVRTLSNFRRENFWHKNEKENKLMTIFNSQELVAIEEKTLLTNN